MGILEVALSQYGKKEIAGSKHNPLILEYHKTTGGFSDDETPWCSSFINWCAIKAGVEHTNKANARSWLNIGITKNNLDIGDVVIFKRGDNPVQGHVAIFIASNGMDYIYVLGGNQNDTVNISSYRVADIIGIRNLRKL